NDDYILPSKVRPSPLVLDIDNNGIELVGLDSADSVFFDFDGDGFANESGWITGGDGFVALDLNEDTFINNGTELLGDQTGYDNGFLALAAYDSNADGVINSEDQIWNDLKVWIDANQNGFSEHTELYTLDDLLITSISLSYTDVSYDIAGNAIKQEG